ncbi:MAG: twin-arginine translocation pathway signal protein [Acidobacteria bacterium]|nr:MAG: twin-arginine translocation pathway signal protein [Acidobacteriota bacterium]PYU76374.1 MAG: twin-arginine translocation pathway signal protein [Acidobacteriota bacterium]
MSSSHVLLRREFLKKSASGGTALVIGFYLPGKFEAPAAAPPVEPAAVNAWVRIAPDDAVTLVIDKSEMGQGVVTSLAMLLAEELELDWKKIKFEFAPAAPQYFNPLFGLQGTGGSTSVRSSWEPLTKAGAAAREMLIATAAKQWYVQPSACHAENGAVVHDATSKRLGYGVLAVEASKLPVPANPARKDPKDYKYIGKPTKRLDTPAKVTGKASFGIDVRLPNMQYAVVARCPVFGGKVRSVDDSKAKGIRGVKQVLEISTGVAVVADNTWSAMEGRRALEIAWDEGSNAAISSDAIRKLYLAAAEKPGAIARQDGDADAALAGAARKVEAAYEVPFLAHATMEPMNCVADVRTDGCDIYAPTQFQTFTQNTSRKITGLKPEQVRVYTTYVGGGFGRRAEQDFIAEAVEISKARGAPVLVTWSREDDMQHDFYRPAAYTTITAGLDADGWPVAWKSRVVSPSIMSRFFPGSVKNGLDNSSVEGIVEMKYGIPNFLCEYVLTDTGVPVGFWRSVGNSQNGYIVESFVDDLAKAGGKDPFEFRRKLLANAPRHRGVLELAAEKAGWGKPLPAGRTRGIAVVESFGSFVAEVAEVSVNRSSGKVRVHRVVCAVDCGRHVNPDTVAAQMEGAIVYGLSAALKGQITINKGRVEQSNFHDYELLRVNDMPQVEVHIMPSNEAPGGAGEPGTPPIAPAVCNAIFAATGKPIRRLPIRAEDLA